MKSGTSKVLSLEDVQKLEDEAVKSGVSKSLMMQNAGYAVANEVLQTFDPNLGLSVLAICGLGNNGGDAMCAARHLARSYRVGVILLGRRAEVKTEEAKMQLSLADSRRINVVEAYSPRSLSKLSQSVVDADLIIDGIFGTGVRGQVREPFSTAIESINSSPACIWAIDLPSGLDPDSGLVSSITVKADETITFYGMKPGLLSHPELCGRIVVKDIGV